jgi:hypothetical protein
MAQLQELGPALNNLLLVAITVGLLGYWIYAVSTYDWTKFDEDSKGDDFLKPIDDNK